MATPVRKMMRRMMTTDRQVEVMAALSSSSLFCLEISLEICFRRMEGLVLLGVIFSGKLIKIWRRQQISVCRRLCLYKSCPINKQRKGYREIIGLNLFYAYYNFTYFKFALIFVPIEYKVLARLTKYISCLKLRRT